ncbi:uncharacterized protein LOC144629866 isoform X6 [Oculina patagonica]
MQKRKQEEKEENMHMQKRKQKEKEEDMHLQKRKQEEKEENMCSRIKISNAFFLSRMTAGRITAAPMPVIGTYHGVRMIVLMMETGVFAGVAKVKQID